MPFTTCYNDTAHIVMEDDEAQQARMLAVEIFTPRQEVSSGSQRQGWYLLEYW
jgi:hypothetical protein